MLLTMLLLNQTSFSRGIAIQFRNEEESGAFDNVFQQWNKEANAQGAALEVFIFMFDGHDHILK